MSTQMTGDEPITCEECSEELYRAGERVPPGLYKQVDSSHQVRLETADVLPAGMDGHATVYVRVQHTWAQIQESHTA